MEEYDSLCYRGLGSDRQGGEGTCGSTPLRTLTTGAWQGHAGHKGLLPLGWWQGQLSPVGPIFCLGPLWARPLLSVSPGEERAPRWLCAETGLPLGARGASPAPHRASVPWLQAGCLLTDLPLRVVVRLMTHQADEN